MSRWRQKKWRLVEADPEAVRALQQALGCSMLAARLLVNRGLSDPVAAQAFLRPAFSHLADPFLLPDAEVAAERIKQALARRERISVHGDYDSDGVTSAALWARLLEKLGAEVTVHVPHRHRDGYDIRAKFVEQAQAEGVKLIITTDCGIQRYEEVVAAREAGIDIIITDHHQPGGQLPPAVAVVNPHRADSRYPFRDLAGVGVAYRMGEALARHLGLNIASYRRAYCDLAAIGTVTDIMPLLGDNRVFVKHGLPVLQQTQKPGLQALMASAGLVGKPLTAHSIGYVIGPRLNAIGRVDDAKLALDLLLTRDPAEGARLAAVLERANNERKQEEMRILAEAMEQMARRDITSTSCLVLSSPGWHAGVIGIVANKLVERCGRPTVLIAVDEESGQGRGSARSIAAFNMLDAITACGHHLVEFGGHHHAAGLSIETAELEAFGEAMNSIAASQLTEEDFVPTLEVDAELDAAEVTTALMRELAAFEPWGHGNREPLLISRSLAITDVRRVGKEQQHLKLSLSCDGMARTDAVMWGVGDIADHLHPEDHLDLCYRPGLNSYNGYTNVQFTVEDLRPSGLDEW